MPDVYALCGGYIELDRSTFFSDVAPGTRVTTPVICFLIAHPRGHVVVDTGVHRGALTDPVGRMGERRASLFRLRSAPTDEVMSQLALLGIAPDDVRYVVNSHLHFDHCGGNEFFPHSTFLVQRAEMEAARAVLAGTAMRYNPSAIDFDHPLDYQMVDGEHDLFGDGKVADFVLTADACYTRENMDRHVLPNVLWDPAEMSRSLEVLRQLRDRQGATVIYGHDTAQWDGLRRAPAALA